MRFLVIFFLMLAFWIALSGEFTVILVVSAIVASSLVSHISRDLMIEGDVDLKSSIVVILRTIKYLPWLLWQTLKSNVDVAYRVLHPSMPIDPRIIEFDSGLKTDTAIANLSNSITLTPGTVTISATKDGRFIVHALSEKHAEELLAGDMQARIKRIEEL